MADDYRNVFNDPNFALGLVTVGMVGATGVIDSGTDQDVFQVRLIKGQTYVFNVRALGEGVGTLSDTTLDLRDLGGTSLRYVDDGGALFDTRMAHTATYTGVHYLDVGSLNDLVGTYQVDASTARGFEAPSLRLAEFGSGAAAGGWSSDDLYHREMADVNGDRRADIVGFGFGGTTVSLATAGGGFAAPSLVLGAFGAGAAAGSWTSEDLYVRDLADVNGDTLEDIVGFGFAGVSVALATGGGNFGAANFVLGAFGAGAAAGGWSSDLLYNRELADVNGDGRADIVGFGAAGVTVALATGGGNFAAPNLVLNNFGTSPAGGGWTDNDRYARKLADVNGDFRADIVGFGETGVFVSLATGGGNFAAATLALADFGVAQGWTSDNLFPRELADLNDDQRADIVAFGTNGYYVAFATGTGTFAAPVFMGPIYGSDPGAGGWSSDDAFPRELADVNGDQHFDIVAFGATGVTVSEFTGLL